MYKALVGCAIAILFLLLLLKSLYSDIRTLKEQNEALNKTLQANLQEAVEKEKRNSNELERLQKKLTDLSRFHDSCLDSPVNDNLVGFLQQLQQDSAGTISFTFTK